MALYFLDYDLRRQRNYQKLYDELTTFKTQKILNAGCYFPWFQEIH